MDPMTVGSAGAGPDTGAQGLGADKPMPRRRFMRMLLGFSVVSTIAMVVTPIIGFLIPKKVEGAGTGGRTLAAKTEDLPGGTGIVVAMGSVPVIVVNGEAGVKAFSAVCPHLGCIVEYDQTIREILCPCHDGHFNPTNGAVISGPPPGPLPPVNVVVEDDSIFLVG